MKGFIEEYGKIIVVIILTLFMLGFGQTGLQSEAPNFPKSSAHSVFLRGTGIDSTQKTLVVNGLHMLPQNFWIKGKVLVDLLNQTEYIQ